MADLSFQQGLQLLESRAKVTVPITWCVIVLSAAMALTEIYMGIAGFDVASSTDGLAIMLVGLISLAWTIAYFVSVVIVGMWIYRAHANLFAAGYDDLEFSPGWSVGWFFVPFANLFKPFQAMRELVNVSAGASNSFGQETPGSVKIWWACYLIGNIVSSISLRIELNAGPDGFAVASIVGAISSLFIAAAGWFLLQVVKDVMQSQRDHVGVHEAFA